MCFLASGILRTLTCVFSHNLCKMRRFFALTKKFQSSSSPRLVTTTRARYPACSSLSVSSRSRRLVPPLSQRYTPEARNQRRPPDSPRWAKKRRRRRTRPRPSPRRTATAATASFAPCARSPSPSRTSASTRKSSRWSRKVRRARSRPAFQHASARRDDHANECCASPIPHETIPHRLAPRLTAPVPRSIQTRSLQAQAGEARREGSGQGAPQGHQRVRPRFRTHRGFPRNRAPRRPDRRPAVREFSRAPTRSARSLLLLSFSLTLPFFSHLDHTLAAFASSRATSPRST